MFLLEYSDTQKQDKTAAIAKLNEIAEKLNSLATEAPTLTEKIYNKARKNFDENHKTS